MIWFDYNGEMHERCMMCCGTGTLRAKRKAAQFNGPSIDYDEVKVPCPACSGTGIKGSFGSAPCSRRTV